MRGLLGFTHKGILGFAAGAFALAVCAFSANAADLPPRDSSLGYGSLLAPAQPDSLYGVRPRDDRSNLPALHIAVPGSASRNASMLMIDTSGAGGLGANSAATESGPAPSTRCALRRGQAVCTRDYLVVAPGSGAAPAGSITSLAAPVYQGFASSKMPYATGIATLVKGAWPNLSSNQLADVFFDTAGSFGVPLAANPNTSPITRPMQVEPLSRDFRAGLARTANSLSFDPVYALLASQYTDVAPFAFGIDSPVGPLFASGYATDTTIPNLISGLYLDARGDHAYDLRDFSLGVAITPRIDLNLGYHMDMGGRFNSYDANASSAYDGLFLSASAVNSPYASLADGGTFVGSTIALADDLHLRFGEVSLSPEHERFNINSYSMIDQLTDPRALYQLRRASGTMAGVSWDFARWGGLGMTATQIDERGGLLGSYNTDALSVADGAKTTALGVSARIGFGDGWVTTASYSEGITQLDLKPSSLFASATDLHSRAYGIAVAKHGLFGDDSLGFAVTRPIQIYSGSAGLAGPADDLMLNRDRISLAGIKPETDIELGYVTTFLDGALALQANAAYQMNTQGQTGTTNSLSLISRAKIKF